MPTFQMIRSPSGDELVVLTRADYDALVSAAQGVPVDEDEADAALFAERMTELAGDSTGRLPAEVSDRMLRGDRLLLAIRKWKGMKQRQVSTATGFSQGYLSDLENGRRILVERAAKTLAEFYGVPLEWLLWPHAR